MSAGAAAASLIAAGLTAAPAIAAPGSLDGGFSGDGVVVTDFAPGIDQGLATAIQKDGKIVVVGITDVDQSPGSPVGPINFDFAMTRYNADGSLDAAFGSGGRVVTSFGSQSDTAFAVVMQPDEKIVVGGASIVDAGANDARFALARYLKDGSLDPGFGSGGRVQTDITAGVDGINALAIQNDGKIVAAGVSNCRAESPSCINADTALARYNKDGSLDATFGNGGKVVSNLGGGDQANAVAVQPNGMVVVGGLAIGDSVDFAVARFSPSGAPDGGFGNGGKVLTAVTGGQIDFANALALQPDGRIVAAGATNKGSGGDDQFALVRYNYDGSLDDGFGTDGKVLTDVGPKADGINDIALLVDGRIVVAGRSLAAAEPFPSRFAIARYLPGGALDGGFGNGGIVTTAIGNNNDEAAGVAIQADGKVVAAGYSAVSGTVENNQFAVVRYDGDGKPLTLPGGGTAAAGSGGYWLTASDGGIFAFGRASFKGSTGDIALVKPIVGMAPTRTGEGYWLVASDGGIFAFGDARFYGSTGDIALVKPIVGMTPTPTGQGYWLVASDGGIFSFGDAAFYGSTGDISLVQPIVAMASTPTGKGYWMVAADGGVFAFGDARFFGSTGDIRLAKPIVGMAPTRSGKGYWMVASDGGIFAFGDASFFGSTGDILLAKPIVGMTATKGGRGYYMVASDGGIFAFGDASFMGSTGDIQLNRPIIGMAAF